MFVGSSPRGARSARLRDVREEQATACIANIGPGERRKRTRFGVAGTIVTAAIAGAMVMYGAPLWMKALLFVPALGTAISFFQVTEQTCVALARRGVSNMDDGERPIEDADIKDAIARQVRRVYMKSAVTALLVTAVFVAI